MSMTEGETLGLLEVFKTISMDSKRETEADLRHLHGL